MQQHSSKCFACRHPDPGDGVNRSKVYFSEHCHVVNQIKRNHKILLQTPLASDFRGRVVTNVVRTCDPTPLLYIFGNKICLK